MLRPRRSSRGVPFVAAALAALGAVALGPTLTAADVKDKPKLSLKASPAVAFSPVRVVVTAVVTGGPNDYEKFYCATVEWDWGDGTRSESSYDCDPYVPGKSEIRRRFSTEHRYRVSGDYRIQLRLKQKDEAVAVVNTVIRVRPGLGEGGVGR